MPIIYQDKRILTPEEYEQGYSKRNQNKLPQKRTVVKPQPRVNRATYQIIAFIVVCINILSGGHTIPTMASLYPSWAAAQYLIAIAGFIGIEGSLLFLMAQVDRGDWERRAILVSFAAAVATNVYAVVELASKADVTASVSAFLGWIGVFLGVVVPILNVAFGEVMHRKTVERQEELKQIEEQHAEKLAAAETEYVDAMSAYVQSWQRAYKGFLTRVGIKGSEDQEYVLSGFAEIDYLADQELKSVPQVEQTLNPVIVPIVVQEPEPKIEESFPLPLNHQ